MTSMVIVDVNDGVEVTGHSLFLDRTAFLATSCVLDFFGHGYLFGTAFGRKSPRTNA